MNTTTCTVRGESVFLTELTCAVMCQSFIHFLVQLNSLDLIVVGNLWNHLNAELNKIVAYF